MVPTQPHLLHLPLRHSTAVIDDPCGLKACGLVELNEQLPHHVGQILDDLLAEELLLQQNIHSTVNDTGPSSEGIMSERAHRSPFTWDMSCLDVWTRTVAQ